MFFFNLSSNILKIEIYCYFKYSPLLMKNKREKNPNFFVDKKSRINLPNNSNKFSEIQLITIDLASPEKIKEWAEKKLPNGKIFGQVTNPNTLHYKTLKPLKGGLFCERVFGPIKNFECACGIHKQKPFHRIISFQNKQFCTKCDIEYTWSDIRRYQLGYIELVNPITHLWYLKGIPSYIRSVLGAKKKHIEGIAYCSEINTIDKAWKPNRLIPFPEIISTFYSNKKKPIVDLIKIQDYRSIYNNNFQHFNDNKKNVKHLNAKFVKKKIFNRILHESAKILALQADLTVESHFGWPKNDSKIFFGQYNKNFIKLNNIKQRKCLAINPLFYNIENCSYKNKVYLYRKIFCSIMKINVENKGPIYVITILYNFLFSSTMSVNILPNFYNTEKNEKTQQVSSLLNLGYTSSAYKKKFLVFKQSLSFNNLYMFTKLKKFKKLFSYINSKKKYIQKNFIYFKTEKLKNLKIFTSFKLLSKISNNILFYYLKKKKSLNKNFIFFKIHFFDKKMNFNHSTLFHYFSNHIVLLYLNLYSFHFVKNNFFFNIFYQLLQNTPFKMMVFELFNVFIMPISSILDRLIIKWYIESKSNFLTDSKTYFVLSSKVHPFIRNKESQKKLIKSKFVIVNFSLYEEASEILWQNLWSICSFFTFTKIRQKLRKIIKIYNKILIKSSKNAVKALDSWNRDDASSSFKQHHLDSLIIIKKIIKKIKIDKIFDKNSDYLNFKMNIINRITKNKFSLFLNLIKIYFKKILFIYHNIAENSNKVFIDFFIMFFKNFQNKIKKIFIKLLNLEVLPWIFSQFVLTWFYKLKKYQLNFSHTISLYYYDKFNRIQKNFRNSIQENSCCNYEISYLKNTKKIYNKIIFFKCAPSPFYQQLYKFEKTLLIYINQVQTFLKYRKFHLFLKLWFSNFFQKSSPRSTQYFITLYKLNKINLKNVHTLNFLFYQKKWLLKKKQVFYHYVLLKKFNSNVLSLKYFNNFIKFIYSSILKNELLINIFSIQLKQFSNLNFIKKKKLCYSKCFKNSTYFYSFISFSSKKIYQFFLSLLNFENDKFFLNLLCFFKCIKTNLFKNYSWLKKIQTFFYSFKVFTYQQKQQHRFFLMFAKKKKLFQKLIKLINILLFYYQNKLKNQNIITILIKKKYIYILHYLKKLQIKLINETQKYYFNVFQNKKFFQIKISINNLKNVIIFINLKKNDLFSDKKKFFTRNTFNSEFIHLNFKKFFYTSNDWQIILNTFKNQISQKRLLQMLSIFNKHLNQTESLLNYSNNIFKYPQYFNSFFINLPFYYSALIDNFLKFVKKNKILQTRKQYYQMFKSNNFFFIFYFKSIWNRADKDVSFFPFPIKKLENNLFFFILYYQYQQSRQDNTTRLKQNFSFINFYLKFLKHDLKKNFNEAIFSVISESRTNSSSCMIWNNIYSLSNRYCWKSDIALNLFLCFMLSPENPSDILIPSYKRRIHNSSVLREEPPIAGGAIILKFFEELDSPEMKKIDIQLQTILKKIPNKLNEIEILLKYYYTNQKFLKYYSIKKRALIEIEKSILRKLKYIRRLNWVSTNPQFMIIRNLPVLPADLRPIFKIQQQLTASDLNRLYQKVMYRNDRLKRFLKNSTTSNSFEMLFAQRMLQEAVDNLIENGKNINSIEVDTRGRPLKSLGELLKGKKGRFRQNLLGKRVDYSGRSVIVVGPKLKLHECGLPIEMAIELFLPFLIKEILKNKYSLTVRSAKLYIKKHRVQIAQLLRQIVKKQPILLNRAPTLHRLGIQAFLPILVEGKAILLHPLVCSAFNADFDGDQMAVHVPITNEARIETWKLVLSRNNLLSPATGEPILLPSQDMVLGCYYLTIDDLQSLIKKQNRIYRKTNNKSFLIFNDCENIFSAYQRNQIHLHTNIWVRFNNNLESDSIFQEPKEVQVQLSGQYIKIYPEYYQKFDRKGNMYNQIIKTTPGRVLFNLMVKTCFN